MRSKPRASGERARRAGAEAPADARPAATDRAWRRAAYATVALAGLALAVVAFRLHPVGDYFTESDFYAGYAPGARGIQHGVFDVARYGAYGPVYEVALAAAGAASGDLFVAARLLSLASAIALLLLALRVTDRLFGPAAGFWLVLLVALNATFDRYAYSAVTDMLGNALAWASLAALVLLARGRGALLAGACAGLATLTRYNLVGLVAAGLLAAWLVHDDTAARRRSASLFALAFLVSVLPFGIAATVAGHPPAITLVRDAGFYLQDSPETVLEERYGGPGERIARESEPSAGFPFAAVARRLVAGIPALLVNDARSLLGWPAATLALAGLVVLVILRRGRALAILFPFWALGFLAVAPVYYSERYSMWLLPLYLAPAAALLGLAMRAPPAPRWAATAAGLAVAAATLASSVALQRAVRESIPLETIEAGEALRRHGRPGDRVLARKAHAAYAAGMEPVLFPAVGTLDSLGAVCRSRGVDYLYYSWYEARLRPAFAYLLDTSAVVPGLEPLHATRSKPSATYRVTQDLGRVPAWWDHAEERRRIRANVNALLDPSGGVP
jgi:hypothetical protein